MGWLAFLTRVLEADLLRNMAVNRRTILKVIGLSPLAALVSAVEPESIPEEIDWTAVKWIRYEYGWTDQSVYLAHQPVVFCDWRIKEHHAR